MKSKKRPFKITIYVVGSVYLSLACWIYYIHPKKDVVKIKHFDNYGLINVGGNISMTINDGVLKLRTYSQLSHKQKKGNYHLSSETHLVWQTNRVSHQKVDSLDTRPAACLLVRYLAAFSGSISVKDSICQKWLDQNGEINGRYKVQSISSKSSITHIEQESENDFEFQHEKSTYISLPSKYLSQSCSGDLSGDMVDLSTRIK